MTAAALRQRGRQAARGSIALLTLWHLLTAPAIAVGLHATGLYPWPIAIGAVVVVEAVYAAVAAYAWAKTRRSTRRPKQRG